MIGSPIQFSKYNYPSLNPIAGHEITEDNRLRIVDWFVQVFRVLRITSQETFFLAVSLLDNYMLSKY